MLHKRHVREVGKLFLDFVKYVEQKFIFFPFKLQPPLFEFLFSEQQNIGVLSTTFMQRGLFKFSQALQPIENLLVTFQDTLYMLESENHQQQ